MALLPRIPRHVVERALLGALAVFLIAAVCADDPYEPDDTRQQARPIQPGETQSRRLCNPDWVSFTVQNDSVYALETTNLSGGADTTLQLWECVPDSDARCYLQRATLTDDDGGDGGGSRIVQRFSTPRTFYRYDPTPGPIPAWAVVTGKDAQGSEVPSYDLSLSCLSGCADLGAVTVLPAAATRADLVTDLLLGNPGYVARDVELVFSPGGRAEPAAAPLERTTVTVPGGATIRYADVLSSVFGLADAAGALEIRPLGGDVLSEAVLRDPRSASSRGEVFAPIRLGEVAPRNVTRYHVLLGTRDGASARLALCEPTWGPAGAVIRIHGSDGKVLAEREVTLPRYGQVELDLERDLGVSPAPDLSASVQVLRGALLSTSVVVDRASGDVFVQKGLTPSSYPTLLPTRSGTYRTELAIRATSPATASAYFDVGGFRVGLGARSLDVGETWYLADPLAEAAEGSDGVINVPAGLVASARVLSRQATGSLGGSAPDLDPSPYTEGALRVGVLVPPGIGSAELVTSVDSYGSPGLASLLDEEGRFLGAEPTARGLVFGSFAPSDSPLQGREPGPSPLRLEVEAQAGSYYTPRAYALLLSPLSPDIALVRAEGVSRAFDTLALTLSAPVGELPLVLRRIPPGSVVMGSPEGERGRDPDETPHAVAIRRPFLLAEVETSLAQWAAITGRTPPDLPPLYSGLAAGSLPAVNVSWEEVAGPGGFLERLTDNLRARRVSGTFRLPTEAEWEYAARAGTTASFGPLGELESCDRSCGPCLYEDPPIRYCRTAGDVGPRVVGSGHGNAFGLRETAGNAWEWVADWYGPYDEAQAIDPTGPAAGGTRVLRGGGWRSELRLCRAANRFGYPPSGRYDQVGFRIALSIGDR